MTVVATDAAAGETANPGVFTVTRTGPTTAALTVSYTVGGHGDVRDGLHAGAERDGGDPGRGGVGGADGDAGE